MLKKYFQLILVFIFMFNLCGCALLLVGAAGGAGTAFWLEGKISQEANVSISKAAKAVTSALNAMKLNITKTTTKEDVVQIIAEYSDKRVIWIDVHKVTDSASRIEIRVGAKGDKEASRKILEKIKRYL